MKEKESTLKERKKERKNMREKTNARMAGWLVGWLVLWHARPCWVISCQNQSLVSRLSQQFCNMLVCASLLHVYHVTKAIQVVRQPALVGSIVVLDALTCWELLHSVF